MRKSYFKTLLSFAVVLTSLSSCSRANYSFNNAAPAYLGTTHARVATSAPAEQSATEDEAAAPALPTQQATVVASHATATRAPQRAARVATPAAASARPSFTKADRKEVKQSLRQLIKQQKTAAPDGVAASGKSQLVAALLCFFLGGLGIHRFYLGYTGLGILYIALALTSFLIVPAIALFVLILIDLVRILIGSLKPKGGEYAKTL